MRLAHFSDLHVTASPAAEPARELAGKRLVGLLNYYVGGRRRHFAGAAHRVRRLIDDLGTQGVDHALCTGDLTGMSYESEFRRCATSIDGTFGRPEKLTVLPGNHDRYTRASVRERRFERHLGHLASPTGSYPFVKHLGSQVALVALDVSRPCWPFDASGKCGREQLERLRSVLRDGALGQKYVVLALHYGPCAPDGSRVQPRLGLRDGRRLLDLIDAQDVHVDLVLHGHHHDPFMVRTRRRTVVCSGSATDLSRACGYNVYEIDAVRRTFVLERREWEPREDRYRSARWEASETKPECQRIRRGSVTTV